MARILLAEDDDSMRQFLSRALEKAGHSVVSAADGVDAMAKLDRGKFDLLVADIVMPEMDGVELARRVVQTDASVKVMFITGFAAVAMQQKADQSVNAKVLSKPFHLKDLVGEIERTLAA